MQTYNDFDKILFPLNIDSIDEIMLYVKHKSLVIRRLLRFPQTLKKRRKKCITMCVFWLGS